MAGGPPQVYIYIWPGPHPGMHVYTWPGAHPGIYVEKGYTGGGVMYMMAGGSPRYICMHMFTYTYACMPRCDPSHIYIYTHGCAPACIHIHPGLCVHIYVYKRTCIYMAGGPPQEYVCIYMYMYVHICSSSSRSFSNYFVQCSMLPGCKPR